MPRRRDIGCGKSPRRPSTKSAGSPVGFTPQCWTTTALEVVVTDNGRGFDTQAAAVSSSHLGIQSMRERAAMLGGTVSFTSKGTGTRILVQIPLTGQQDQ